jgi:Zn-dependent peptidase ImmA (M78 family)/DNA-binding XRE family transcriptional regulator
MNGFQLKRAREICRLTQAELAERLGVQQALIAMLERGTRDADTELLEKISAMTGFPTAFFLDYPQYEFPLGSLLYRKFSRLSHHEKTHSHRVIEQCFTVFMRMTERLRMIPLRIPRRMEDDPFTAAHLVRSSLGYDPDAPLKHLINRLERCGVIIFTLPEEVENLDAFSTWVNGTIPIIVISPWKPGDRQRFSIAHELAHLLLHQTLQGDFDAIEKEADQFAGELLFPEEAARQELVPPITLSGLAELKRKREMSLQALIFKALEIEVMDQRQANSLRVQLSKKGWRKKEPDGLYIQPEKPRALRKMAEVLYGDPIRYQKFAHDMHMPVFWLKQLIDGYAGKEEFENKGKTLPSQQHST